jgi:dihydroneopterin aldolase
LAQKAMLDRITLSGIKLSPCLGVSPEERAMPCSCAADVTIWGDFEAAAATDDLSAAVDYSRVLAKVIEVSLRSECRLLETLAYRIGRAVLENFPVHHVNVRVRKQPAALLDALDWVEAEVQQP